MPPHRHRCLAQRRRDRDQHHQAAKPAPRHALPHALLRTQQHCAAGRVQEAVLFAQRTLSQLRGPSAASLEPSLRDVVALVAYQDPQASPLAHLMGRGQRDAVADAVNAAILAVVSEPSGGGAAAAGGGGAAAAAEPLPPPQLQLRPALAAGASELAAAVAAAASRPVSAVEALLQQLVAVQGSLHEANGGQGSAFNLQEYMPGPAT
ncbi:hypothetical protein PLESTM_001263500 [Pleodorina starrii]|nr:hypothetical protein PLESTM_001263500 [Pleodorina starrii]